MLAAVMSELALLSLSWLSGGGGMLPVCMQDCMLVLGLFGVQEELHDVESNSSCPPLCPQPRL